MRPAARIKLLVWDGSGLWVCAKRLEQGRFGWDWPQEEAQGAAVISHEALSMLLGGIDLRQVRSRRNWYRKIAA